jgi:hypothetical protein
MGIIHNQFLTNAKANLQVDATIVSRDAAFQIF